MTRRLAAPLVLLLAAPAWAFGQSAPVYRDPPPAGPEIIGMAGPQTAGPPLAAAAPKVTLPAARQVAIGERFSLAPVVTNGGEPRWYLPDGGALKEDRILYDIIPDELTAKLKGRIFYADAAGTFRVVCYAAGDNRVASDIAVCTVTVGAVPPTPPGPNPPGPQPPGPTPGPTPGPAPIPADGFRALIVYETADLAKLPKDQLNVLYSQTVRGYLDTHCAKGPDGKTPEWRIWDQNVPTGAESKVWQDAMAAKRDKLPWLIVSNGKTGFAGPLPANTDATLRLLQQYGGQ